MRDSAQRRRPCSTHICCTIALEKGGYWCFSMLLLLLKYGILITLYCLRHLKYLILCLRCEWKRLTKEMTFKIDNLEVPKEIHEIMRKYLYNSKACYSIFKIYVYTKWLTKFNQFNGWMKTQILWKKNVCMMTDLLDSWDTR